MKSDFKPIAIIGIGCRLPGGCNDVDQYWELLRSGRDAITETPNDRWNVDKFYAADIARRGKTQSRWGGYVDGIDAFDPDLFGISPREAACMDPQQRLLLETAYRAAEDAGVPLQSLAGQPVSVHVGISSIDYAVAGLSFEDRAVIGPYSNTGGSSSIAANRISYCFDLRGESVAVDTACSSSLIATHLACRCLQDPGHSMAFAGGVNAILLPDFNVAFSQLGVLSPDGRCKTFDASANGYVRSEGAGMVLLKRLDDAVRDGDPIYAVIRGSATNQDGRTEGITLPSREAQIALIQSALDRAGVSAADVGYVEAHGTGTPVGDPIEAAAIAACYGRTSGPSCRVGSVKTNIGHLEAGAGIASVIKVALSLHHRHIPAHLNLRSIHPEIGFENAGLTIPLQSEAWTSDGQRLAGINGFGYGGANAHLVLSEAPPVSPPTTTRAQPTASDSSTTRVAASSTGDRRDCLLLPISAHNAAALAKTATSWADWLQAGGLQAGDHDWRDVARAAATRRTHHATRAAVIGENQAEWIEGLRRLADEPETHSQLVHSQSRDFGRDARPPIAFICSGQGPQWWAMGRSMLENNGVFRNRIESCDREFAKYITWSLVEELLRDESTSRMNATSIAQPSLFALQVALADVWAAMGIRPSIVVGHSVGEIAAAYLSGALSFQDACCVAVHRGRTMDAATSRGAMLAVGITQEEAEHWIASCGGDVSIAAINGPTSLTLSGGQREIDVLQERLQSADVFCRRLQVEYAFHSSQMDPVEDELRRSLAGIQPGETHTPMVSTVTGAVIDGPRLDGVYWWRNVRESVRFADAMNVVAQRDIPLAIEIGPHPVLSYAITECFASQKREITTIASLNRRQEDRRQFAESLGKLFTWGYPIDWRADALHRGERNSQMKLPPMEWDKRSLWSESFESKRTRDGRHWHPVLGERVDGALIAWQRRIDLTVDRALADHCVRHSCVLPAAAMLKLMTAAGREILEQHDVSISKFRLINPCLLSDEAPIRLQTSYDPDRRRLMISQASLESTDWKPIASASLSGETAGRLLLDEAFGDTQNPMDESVCHDALYRHCVSLGLHYGPTFRGVQEGVRGDRQANVVLDPELRRDGAERTDPLGTEAALLDSCFHAMVVADPDFHDPNGGLYLPQQIQRLDWIDSNAVPAKARVRIRSKDAHRMVADLAWYSADGELCGVIRGFESVRVLGTGRTDSVESLLYRYVWRPAERVEPDEPAIESRKWLVFADQCGLADQLIDRLPAGDGAIKVQHGAVFKRLRGDSFIIDPENRDHFQRLLQDIGDAVTHIVYLWGIDCPDNVELDQESLEKSTLLSVVAPMHLVQAWQDASERKIQTLKARLAVVTRDAQPIDPTCEPLCVSAGPLIGFTRVVASEIGSLQTRLVDLSSQNADSCQDLADEVIFRNDDEDEVQYRDAIRWVRRFVPHAEVALPSESGPSERCRLQADHAGSIENLKYVSTDRRDLNDGEVEIAVSASALNFSDVMKALGLYPGLPDGPVALGAECSGRISRVGPGVSEWSEGDEVVAIASGAFASHVVVDAQLVARKPANLSHQQAACIPIAYLTADYALNECARIRSGERVLIHSASGGVGIAAMQLATLAGAELYATAGTDEKREFVRQRGAGCVMNSRDLSFATEVMRQTDGAGVDVILNSLPGDAILRGLEILSVGGRFLEIGKRDIYADLPVGLEPFQNNLAFFAIDLDQLIRKQPRRVGEMLRRMMKRFEDGELAPLPTLAFSADETADAFRHMQQAKHIGKVVIDYSAAVTAVYPGDHDVVRFKPNRTYWVAGGLGGFGLRLAQWLVDCGAKHLVLGGRSQNLSDHAERELTRWKTQGVDVRVMPVDLASMASVQSVADRIERECPPLAGVFHTAMVLEDRLIADLDRNTLNRVLRPKVHGGWNLHRATSDCDLEHFVLFSSLSSVFGHAGQANYSAANALLDSLAHYRRSIGMRANVINWGHLGGVGYLAERSELSDRLKRQGVLSFSPDEAMRCLAQAMQSGAIQLSVLRMDWSLWRGLGITGEVSPRFRGLIQGKRADSDGTARIPSAAEIHSASAEDQAELIASAVADKAAALLGMASDELPLDRPLLSLGLDSLMAVELRNWIESQLKIDLPIANLMRGEGIRAICETLADSLVRPLADTESTDDLLEQLPEMSDQTVDELLARMINEAERESPGE